MQETADQLKIRVMHQRGGLEKLRADGKSWEDEDTKESWLLGLIHGYLFHLQTVVRTER